MSQAGTSDSYDDAPRYRVYTFKNGLLKSQSLTRLEVLALDPELVDLFIDRAFGRVNIHLPDGTFKQEFGGISGLGTNGGMELLDDVLWGLGELLTAGKLKNDLAGPRRIARRATRVYRLRIALYDSAKLQWFFFVLRDPWRIGWNTQRSWMLIECD